MILVRNIFQLKFGRAKDAIALMKESATMKQGEHAISRRVLTDLTGTFYTMVLEETYNNLSEMEKEYQEGMSDPEWHAWYLKFSECCQGGSRELMNVVM